MTIPGANVGLGVHVSDGEESIFLSSSVESSGEGWDEPGPGAELVVSGVSAIGSNAAVPEPLVQGTALAGAGNTVPFNSSGFLQSPLTTLRTDSGAAAVGSQRALAGRSSTTGPASGRALGALSHHSLPANTTAAGAGGSRAPAPAPAAAAAASLRPRAPLLWRLFPRCIRAGSQECCIAAEVTLPVAPSDCSVTAVRDGRPLAVRLEFLTDRQAVGDEGGDQEGADLSGGAGGGAALRRRRAARDVLRMLRPQQPDSELVLIWLVPGEAAGMVLIELHARIHDVMAGRGAGAAAATGAGAGAGMAGGAGAGTSRFAGAGGQAREDDGEGSGVANGPLDPASTGWLRTAWRSGAMPGQTRPGSLSASAAAGGVGGVGVSGGGVVGVDDTVQLGAPMALSAGAMEVGLYAAAGRRRAGATGLHPRAAGGAAAGVHGSTERLARLDGSGSGSGSGSGRGSGGTGSAGTTSTGSGGSDRRRAQTLYSTCSSGALTLVVVPDAGMEAEVCRLLSQQYQQTPLPVCGGAAAGIATGPGAAEPEAAAAASGAAAGGGANAAGCVLVGGLLPGDCGVDEDDDDARARERFLWDLGAWLEFSNEQAALRRHAAAEAAEAAAMAAAMREATSGSRGIPTYTPLLRPSTDGIVDYFASPLAPALPPSTAEGGGNASASAAASVAAPGVEAAAAARNMTPGMQGSLPRTALELLGFACSRGWAAVSTHIVLGLMDMGLSMTAINAAVQAAHGWSALHLAAASGSPELMGMMALWRSYGAGAAAGAAGAGAAGAGTAAGEIVGGDEGELRGTAAAAAGGGSARRRGGDVAEEWRAMVAAPGPGGLTPLHLAAVLPAPAAAALDLLSGLAAEALPAWFSVAARDGCTPAHYASRAGNSHLNDHALLCLALGLGTAALDAELGAAAGGAGPEGEGAGGAGGGGGGAGGQWGTPSVMQEVLPYYPDLQADMAAPSLTHTDSIELWTEPAGVGGGGAAAAAGGDNISSGGGGSDGGTYNDLQAAAAAFAAMRNGSTAGSGAVRAPVSATPAAGSNDSMAAAQTGPEPVGMTSPVTSGGGGGGHSDGGGSASGQAQLLSTAMRAAAQRWATAAAAAAAANATRGVNTRRPPSTGHLRVTGEGDSSRSGSRSAVTEATLLLPPQPQPLLPHLPPRLPPPPPPPPHQQQEQPQRGSSNNGDDAGSDSHSRTLETSLSFNRDDTDADGDAGASHAARRSDQQPQPQDPPPGHRRVLASLVAGAAAAGAAAAGPRAPGAEDVDFGLGVRNRRRGNQEERLANLRTVWNWRGERSLATAFGAPPVTGSESTPAAPGAATGVGAASPVPGVAGADGYMTYTTAAAVAASTAFTAAGAAAAAPPPSEAPESESWWSEPWGSNARRTWPDPNTIISGLLERVSPVASAHGSLSPATSPWRSPSTTPVPSNNVNTTSAPAAGLGGQTRGPAVAAAAAAQPAWSPRMAAVAAAAPPPPLFSPPHSAQGGVSSVLWAALAAGMDEGAVAEAAAAAAAAMAAGGAAAIAAATGVPLGRLSGGGSGPSWGSVDVSASPRPVTLPPALRLCSPTQTPAASRSNVLQAGPPLHASPGHHGRGSQGSNRHVDAAVDALCASSLVSAAASAAAAAAARSGAGGSLPARRGVRRAISTAAAIAGGGGGGTAHSAGAGRVGSGLSVGWGGVVPGSGAAFSLGSRRGSSVPGSHEALSGSGGALAAAAPRVAGSAATSCSAPSAAPSGGDSAPPARLLGVAPPAALMSEVAAQRLADMRAQLQLYERQRLVAGGPATVGAGAAAGVAGPAQPHDQPSGPQPLSQPLPPQRQQHWQQHPQHQIQPQRSRLVPLQQPVQLQLTHLSSQPSQPQPQEPSEPAQAQAQARHALPRLAPGATDTATAAEAATAVTAAVCPRTDTHAPPGAGGVHEEAASGAAAAAATPVAAAPQLQHLAPRGVMTGVAPGAAAWTAAAVVVAAMLLPQLQALASDVLPRLLGIGGATTALVALMALVAARLMPRRLGAAREVPN